jgi:hypothetical protein
VSDPLRLRDMSESGFERALLDAGVAYRSSEATKAKTLAALGLAGSAAVSVGVASLGASSLVGKLGWTKLLAISGLGAATVGPVGYYTYRQLQPEPAPYVAPAAPAVAKVAQRAPAPSPAPEQVAAEMAPAVDELPPVEAPSAPAARADRATSQSALAAELAALDQARARLDSGDASGALSLLDDYSRTYPRGRLALEAEVLRIDALAKKGQSAAAAKRAEAFLRRHPNSVLASRVRGYLPE